MLQHCCKNTTGWAHPGRAHPRTPTPLPDSRAREGGGVYSIEVPAPGAGPTTWGGPTPLNRKKGVPTLPFIA